MKLGGEAKVEDRLGTVLVKHSKNVSSDVSFSSGMFGLF